MRRIVLAAVAAAALGTVEARPACAQAWVPPKGEGSVSILFQDLVVKDHFLAGGGRIDRGRIDSNNLLFDITYALSDRIAVNLTAPFIRTRYTGTAPHPTAQDDGQAHTAFQDLRFGARYNLVDGPVTITPFVGTNVPSHSYEYFAHAAYGTHVRELEVGTYIGRMLSPAIPGAFVQARYSYAFAQRIENIHHDRSNLDLELGYFLTPRIRAFAIATGQKTHGGIDTPDAGWKAMPPNLAPHHDRIARLEMLDFGGGVQATITSSFDVFGSFMKTTAGRNAHALSRGMTIGASWRFGGGLPSLAGADSDSDSASGSHQQESVLPRCLCQKK
jgi:hypothetical protein